MRAVSKGYAANAEERAVSRGRYANETLLLNSRKDFVFPVRAKKELCNSDVGKIFGFMANKVYEDVEGLPCPRRRPNDMGQKHVSVFGIRVVAPRIPLIGCLGHRAPEGFDANVRYWKTRSDSCGGLHRDVTTYVGDYLSGKLVLTTKCLANVSLK